MINIKETFLTLTKRRYPKGTEDLAMELVKNMLPYVKFIKDEFDNYYTYIPKADGTDSDTMFTSHLDTVNSSPLGYYNDGKKWDYDLKKYVVDPDAKVDDMSVKHIFDGDFVKTDGQTNLGADDKAGTTIMMNMISENIPGLYYFFMGEETGCVGSSNLSRVFESKGHPKMNKCISFDRRGYDSIITEQTSVCASNEFATELASRFNEYGFWFKPDPTGIYTDSAEFTDIIPECTNISCGYFHEHTKFEKQDLEFLELLAIVATQINWDTLPIVRDKDKVYTGKKSRTYGRYSNWNNWDDYDCNWNSNNRTTGYVHNSNHLNKSKSKVKSYTPPINNSVYEDDGYGNLKKVNNDSYNTDFDFDKWYGEQKTKSSDNK